MADQNIIVCRTADGDLVKYDSYAQAVEETIKAAGKDLSEIVIMASHKHRLETRRKIGRAGLLLHDIINDKNATEEEKAEARKKIDEIDQSIIEDSLEQIAELSSGSDREIESIEVVYYLGACDNIYENTQEYYDNYKKRQALNGN